VAVLKQVPIDRGEEIAILDNVRFGLWSVTRAGVVFLSTDGQVDQLSLYEIVNRQVRTLGKLQFRTSRIGGYGQLRVSRDGRWVLLTTTDHWESDIMVADGFR
jgi:hypothetical protein